MQYDAMRSEGREEPPPWQPEDEKPAAPPWQPAAQPRDEKPAAPKQSAVDLAEKANRTELDRLGFKDKKNWNDVRADKMDNAAQKMEERLHESHANKLMMDRIRNPNGGATFKQDEEGMAKAYNDATYPGVYYDQDTNTMYVKGTVDAQDWWDDFSKVPVWGNLRDSRRYKDAEFAYNDLLKRGLPIDRIVGHSLGGSIALQQQKDKNIDFSRTFGAPVVDLNPLKRGTQERYRHILDPVSIFDRGASFGDIRSYPHSYSGFQGYDQPSETPRGLGLDHKFLALHARNHS